MSFQNYIILEYGIIFREIDGFDLWRCPLALLCTRGMPTPNEDFLQFFQSDFLPAPAVFTRLYAHPLDTVW